MDTPQFALCPISIRHRDSPEGLKPQADAIAKDAVIRVLPYGTITKGQMGEELSEMEALAPLVCGFSDDGKGV